MAVDSFLRLRVNTKSNNGLGPFEMTRGDHPASVK
jgi:hypothetical protein